jgi:hypothetical protein
MPKIIDVDLDGTLAHHDRSKKFNPLVVGAPVPRTVARVRAAVEAGHKIRIFTARVSISDTYLRERIRDAIALWADQHLGFIPDITHEKSIMTSELWDDRAVRVEANTGEPGTLDGTLWATLGE